MIKPLDVVRIEKHKSLHQQVQDQVRALIVSGALAPGDKLPSTQELAALFQTHVPTVHTALTQLVREGLIVRYPAKGTFVCQREERLTRIGLYYGTSFPGTQPSLFQLALQTALKEHLTAEGLEVRIYVDTRPDTEHAVVWPELRAAVERREVQALINPMGGGPHVDWLERLPIPTVHHSWGYSNGVWLDVPQLARVSLQRLAEQGCRSVGLIVPISARVPQTKPPHVLAEFFREFAEVAAERGLRIKNEWVRTAGADGLLHGRTQEEYGYSEFNAIWGQQERPDGLVVMPDTVARGVILAVSERQVRVPAELKLVLHKNKGVDLFCPMPATLAISSERDIAAALLEQAQRQFRGEKCESVLVRCALAESQSQQTNSPAAGKGSRPS